MKFENLKLRNSESIWAPGMELTSSATTKLKMINYNYHCPTWLPIIPLLSPPPEQTLLLHLILQSVHSKAKRQRQSVNILVDTAIIKIVLLRRKNPRTWGESRGRLHRLWSEGSWRLCPQAQAVHWSKPSSWIARCHFMPNSILPHRSKVSMPCLKNSWSVCREFTSMISIMMVIWLWYS